MSSVPDFAAVLTPWAVLAAPAPTGGHPGEACFTGRTMPTPWPAAYGGDLSVGALAAAARTVEPDQRVHSLNLNFLRPGDAAEEFEYRVHPLREGVSYDTRAVSLWQADWEVANATVSFRRRSSGEQSVGDVGIKMPAAPAPETLPTAAEAIGDRGALLQSIELDRYWITKRGLDVRHVNSPSYGAATAEREGSNQLWVRLDPASAALAALRATAWGGEAMLTYLADDTILEPALRARGLGWNSPGLFSTSIDQKIWFHADAVPGEWLLFDQRLLSSAGSHVVCEGQLFREDGALVATVVQEGIVRTRHAGASE